MSFDLLLGIFAVGFGIYTLYARARTPNSFGKLAAMKKQWGDRTGTIVHVVAYTVMPILVGLVLIASSLTSGGVAPQ